jgi:maltoporin
MGIEELPLMLKGQVFVVDGEVRLRALTAKGELADVGQMLFTRITQIMTGSFNRFVWNGGLASAAARREAENKASRSQQK